MRPSGLWGLSLVSLPKPQSPHLYNGDHALCTSERLGEIKIVILIVKVSPGRPAQLPGVIQPFPAWLEPAVLPELLPSVTVMVMLVPFRPVHGMPFLLWQGKMGPERYLRGLAGLAV